MAETAAGSTEEPSAAAGRLACHPRAVSAISCFPERDPLRACHAYGSFRCKGSREGRVFAPGPGILNEPRKSAV
jgi:hypothetical protein